MTNDHKATESDWCCHGVRFGLCYSIGYRLIQNHCLQNFYPSVDGGAVKPWDYTRRAIDLEEQRRAFWPFEPFGDEPALAGVYFWNWWGPKDGENAWYTIPGKPAMSEVKKYFETRRELVK